MTDFIILQSGATIIGDRMGLIFHERMWGWNLKLIFFNVFLIKEGIFFLNCYQLRLEMSI